MNAGENVQLTCYVSKGDKPLRIGWHFQGEQSRDEHAAVRSSSSSAPPFKITTAQFGDQANIMTINDVSQQHRGRYICTAGNAAGTANFSAHLDVNG